MALLSCYLVRDMVPSEIGELFGEEDWSEKATAHLCDFRLRQAARAHAGKNSIILFGHKVRRSKKRLNRSK